VPAAAAPTTAAATGGDGVIPSPAKDVPDAYLKLPPSYKSVAALPGKGGKVTAAFISYSAPVPPRDQNQYWQEFEKRIGVTYEPNLIAADSYREKMAALVAGGDLPDLTVVEQLNAPDLLKAVNQGAFTDLTPYLDGDALKAFPNLAKIPDYGWKNVKIKKKIYGVPIVRFIPDRAMIFRGDWLDKFGGQKPKNADEFLALMTRFTKEDPAGHGKSDSFGVGGWAGGGGGLWYSHPFFLNMFRAPHTWQQNPDGSLTNVVETPAYKQAIEYIKRLNDAGVFHPDAGSMSIQQAKDGFFAGQFGGYVDGWTAVTQHRDNQHFRKLDPNNPAAIILVPPGFDGGKPAVERSQGFFGMSCIPTTVGKDAERVKELLRIVDYGTAPFGSEEYVFLRWGLQGVHHELQNGAPILNDKGRLEIGALTSGIGRRNDIFYYPDTPEDARVMQQWNKDQLEFGVENPVYGLFSPTAIAKGSELQTLTTDRIAGMIAGREPFSSFDAFVKDWRSRGGDQVRKEYEQELKS
jgi:putative aldouronate transport system substrate-binding protein